MDRGIVYILINPCLDGWVKIGMSTKYFTYQGETLAHLRNLKESREGDE